MNHHQRGTTAWLVVEERRLSAEVDRLKIALLRDHRHDCAVVRDACDCGHTYTPEEVLEDARAIAEIEAKSDEEIDAELRAAGVDVEAGVRRTKSLVRVCLERNRALVERDAAVRNYADAREEVTALRLGWDEAERNTVLAIAEWIERGVDNMDGTPIAAALTELADAILAEAWRPPADPSDPALRSAARIRRFVDDHASSFAAPLGEPFIAPQPVAPELLAEADRLRQVADDHLRSCELPAGALRGEQGGDEP